MAILNIAPTKSSLLSLLRQLAVAEEGYDLLEQKRQILMFEMMSRLKRAREVEQRAGRAVPSAFSALRDATLDCGSLAIDQAALAADQKPELDVSSRSLMGLLLPEVRAERGDTGLPYGVGGTSANTDIARDRFIELLPLLAELAELQTAVARLARELSRTQRRCNALSKVFIPNTRQTIASIRSTLEERERESFVITRMIRDRLVHSTVSTPS